MKVNMNKKFILFALIGYAPFAISMEQETDTTRALQANTQAAARLSASIDTHMQRHTESDAQINTLQTQVQQLQEALTQLQHTPAAPHSHRKTIMMAAVPLIAGGCWIGHKLLQQYCEINNCFSQGSWERPS